MKRVALALLIAAPLLCASSRASEKVSEAENWEEKYEQLLKDRPEIRQKVESGGATKEDVIAWMKNGGDQQKATKKYYGAKIEFKDPAEFREDEQRLVYSGPQPGESLPAFQATGLRGKRKGVEYDPVAAAEGGPLVLILQDDSVVGQKGLLLCGKALARIAERSPAGLHVSTTFLVDDPTPSLVFEYDFMDEIDDVIEMSVSHDRREGPGAYGLDRNVAMTILVARDGRVLHNFALAQPMLYPDPHVFGAIAEAIGVDRRTMAGWVNGDDAYVVAAESDEPKEQRDEETARAESERKRAAGQARTDRNYGRRRLTVEDPDGFAKKQEKPIFSGPQAGEKLAAFQATSLAGDSKGKALDPVAPAGNRPQVIVFQDESGVAIRGLYGVADAVEKIRRKTDKDVHVAVVFLTDDAENISSFAGVFPRLLEKGVDSISLSQDGRNGPGAYGIDRTVSQTIILAKDGMVTRNFVFPQGMLYVDPHVMGGIAELLGEERETVVAWLNEAAEGDARMWRGDDPQGAAKTALREKLRNFVEAGKLSRDEAGELYRAAFPEESR